MKPSPAEIALFLFELIMNIYKPAYLAAFLAFIPLSRRELREEDRARVQMELMYLQAFINDYSIWAIYGGGVEGANIMFAFEEHLRAFEKEEGRAATIHKIMRGRVDVYAEIIGNEVLQPDKTWGLIQLGEEFANFCGHPEDVCLSTAASMYFGATFLATSKAIKEFANGNVGPTGASHG